MDTELIAVILGIVGSFLLAGIGGTIYYVVQQAAMCARVADHERRLDTIDKDRASHRKDIDDYLTKVMDKLDALWDQIADMKLQLASSNISRLPSKENRTDHL